MSDFALHAIQSSQAPRDVELQASLDTRGFDTAALARRQGEHLVTHSVVPRVGPHENWAGAAATAEAIPATRLVSHYPPAILQKMTLSPYVGFRAVVPGVPDVSGIPGMGTVQFPGMAAPKPDASEQSASGSNTKEKEANDPSVNIQTVRTQTLAAHNLNSKEPTEKDRIRKIEEWRNDVAKAILTPQLGEEISKSSQVKQRRRSSRDREYSSDQKESVDVSSGAKGSLSQSNVKDGKKEGKSSALGKKGKGKGKAGIDKEDLVDNVAEVVKPEVKSDDKQMEMKREMERPYYRYDWQLPQSHCNPSLFSNLYPMPFNPTVLQRVPFGLSPGRIPSQPDLPVHFPQPVTSVTPAFPHFALSQYQPPLLHKVEQIPVGMKTVGSVTKDGATVSVSDGVHRELPVTTESSKKQQTSTVSGVHGISELTEASSRSTLVPGQRHYKLVKGTAPSSSSGGKVKGGDNKQKVGKGRKSKVKEQKSTVSDNLLANARPSSPVSSMVTAPVAQATSVVAGSIINVEHGHNQLTQQGLARGRKTKSSPKAEKSAEKRMKTDEVSEQEDGDKDECVMERPPPVTFPLSLRDPSYMYGFAGPLRPLPDERLMAQMPFAQLASAQAAMYGQMTVKQESSLVPPFSQIDRLRYHPGMFKHPEVSSIPPLTVSAKVKDETVTTDVQSNETDCRSHSVAKQLSTPKRPNTLSFVSEEIRNLPGGKLLETQTPEEIEARAREFDRHEALRNLASPVKPRLPPGLVSTEISSPRVSSLVPSEVISPLRNSEVATDGKKADITLLQSEHSAFSAKSVKKRGPTTRNDNQTGNVHVKVEIVSRAGESGHVMPGKASISDHQQDKDIDKDRCHGGDDMKVHRFHQFHASSSGSLSASTASTAVSSPTKLRKKSKQQSETRAVTKQSSAESTLSPVKGKKLTIDVNTSDLMQQFEKLGVGQIRTTGSFMATQTVSTAGMDVHPGMITSSKDMRQMPSAVIKPVSHVSPNLVVTAAQSMLQYVAQNSGMLPQGGSWPLMQSPYCVHHRSLSQYQELLKQQHHPYFQQQRWQQHSELERKQSDRKAQPRKEEVKQSHEKKTLQQRHPTSDLAIMSGHAGTSEVSVRGTDAVVTSSSSSALRIITDKERVLGKLEISILDRQSARSVGQQQALHQDLQATHLEQSPVVRSARPGSPLNKRDAQSIEQKYSSSKSEKLEKTIAGQKMQGSEEAHKLKTMESTRVHVSTEVMNVGQSGGQSGEGLLKASPQEKHDLEKQLLREHVLEMSRWQQSNGQSTNDSNSEALMSLPSLIPKSELYGSCHLMQSNEKKLKSEALSNENSNFLDEKSTHASILLSKLKREATCHGSALVGKLLPSSLPTLPVANMHNQKQCDGHNWIEQRKLERSDAESSGDDMEDSLHLAELRACSVLPCSRADPTEDDNKEKAVNNGVMEYELYELEDLGHPVSGRCVQSMLTGFNYYSLMQPFLTSDTSAIDRAISCGLYRQYKTEESRRIFGNGKSGDLSMEGTSMSKQEVKVRVSLAELQQQYKGHLNVMAKLQKKARRHARRMKLALPKDEEQKIVTPRKRGRPRKQKLVPVKAHSGFSDSQSEGECPTIVFPVEAVQDVPVVKKRGRGRPPKDPNAVRKPLGKKKNSIVVEKTYNISCIQKPSSLTSDEETCEQFASVEQTIDVKRRQGTRCGAASVNSIVKKQEDSDADFSASIHSDSTYDAEEDKVAVKSAKAGWQRRRQRAKKTDVATDLEASVRISFQAKGQTLEDSTVKELASGNKEHRDFLNEMSAVELSVNMAATSGLDALSRCASMALAVSCQDSIFSRCETVMDPATQPKKRGRKSKAVLQDANGGDGGTVVPVSENQTRSSFARQSELPTVAPDTLTSIEVSACDSLPNDLNRKKLETNNSKHEMPTVHSKMYTKDTSSDKPRFRKFAGKRCGGEVAMSGSSRKGGKVAQKDSYDFAVGETDQTRKPPAKRACLVSQEKNEVESSLVELKTSVSMDCHFNTSMTETKTSVAPFHANSDKQNVNSHFHLSPAVLTMDQRVLVRDLEEPKVYSFATIVNPKPPDLYGVIVDGDRRRKVHWLPQEEIMEKGVLNVKPTQECGLPRGCRVCARWSVHQKCYYPGRVLDDVDWTTGQCFVEFDDGDQAWKPLEMVRRIMDSDNENASDRSASPTEDVKGNKDNIVNVQPSECCENSDPSRPSADSQTKDHKDDPSTLTTQNNIWHGHLTWQSAASRDSRMAHYSPISENCESKGFEHPVVNSKENHEKNGKNSVGDSPTSSSLQASSFAGFDVTYSDISSVGSNSMDIESELINGNNLDSSSHISDSRQVDVVLRTPPLSGDLPSRCGELEGSDGVRGDKWEWCGKGKTNNKRRRGRKTYFKSVSHGDCILSEGDSAIFKSRSRRGDPYIGLIEKLYEACGGSKMARVKWFYRGTDIKLQKPVPQDKAGVYLSLSHVDNIPVHAVVKKCQVLSQAEFSKLKPQPNPQKDCIYYKKGVYDQTTGCVDSAYA